LKGNVGQSQTGEPTHSIIIVNEPFSIPVFTPDLFFKRLQTKEVSTANAIFFRLDACEMLEIEN